MRRMYSENQLKEIIENGDIDFKGDIKLNGESCLQVFNGIITVTESLTRVSSYCKAVRNFNELQFIFNVRIKNETENTITIPHDSPLCMFEIPENIKEKIYAHTGNNVNHSETEGSIAMCSLFTSTPTGLGTKNPRYCNLYHSLGYIKMYHLAPSNAGLDIDADETIDLEARISLAL